MLYFVRFFTLVFIYSSCFVIPAQNIVNAGLIIIFDVTIYYLVFSKYTKAVVKSFNKVGVETFKSNYKKSNLYISRNYASAIYFDDVERKIHFLNPRRCVSKFCYSDLVEAEFEKNTLILYFTGEKRLSAPFYYQKEDFGHLNSMTGVILDGG